MSEAAYVMAQLGHTNPAVTLAFYAKVMDRRDGEPERLKALVEGREWTAIDSKGENGTVDPVAATPKAQ